MYHFYVVSLMYNVRIPLFRKNEVNGKTLVLCFLTTNLTTSIQHVLAPQPNNYTKLVPPIRLHQY